jgi:hypothetical protein
VIIKAYKFTVTENELSISLISGSSREADENYAPRGYLAANSGDFLPTFRDNYWSQVQGSIIQDLQWPRIQGGFFTLEDGTDSYPETSVRNYHYSLRDSPKERNSKLSIYS